MERTKAMRLLFVSIAILMLTAEIQAGEPFALVELFTSQG